MGSATCSGKVKIEGKGKAKSYGYAEFKSSNAGGGPRGIEIWLEGAKGKTTYRKLEPNPHDSKKYNKKQSDFYYQLAEAIAKYHDKNNAFPPEGTSFDLFEFDGPYKLTENW